MFFIIIPDFKYNRFDLDTAETTELAGQRTDLIRCSLKNQGDDGAVRVLNRQTLTSDNDWRMAGDDRIDLG